MSFDFLDRRSAERFAELLDETSGGRGRHAPGQADEQLAELVAIGHSLSGARCGIQVEPEFRTGLRAMLVATAERDGVGRAALPHAVPIENTGAHAGAGRRFGAGSGRRIRARGAIVIGVAAGAMAVSGISAASENAAPGDALYGVKRSTERAQLAMAGSDLTRGQLSLDFARHRLGEAAALAGDNARFGDVLADMDNDTRQGVRLLTGYVVGRSDAGPLSTVETFVTAQRQRMTPVLDGLSPTNRAHAIASIGLLDQVRQRAAELRAGLACKPVTPDGTDPLGPKLRNCATVPAGTVPPKHQQLTGAKSDKSGSSAKVPRATPARGGSAADPTPTGEAQPSVDQPDISDPDVTPATADTLSTGSDEQPADQGNADDNTLGGLLNGIG